MLGTKCLCHLSALFWKLAAVNSILHHEFCQVVPSVSKYQTQKNPKPLRTKEKWHCKTQWLSSLGHNCKLTLENTTLWIPPDRRLTSKCNPQNHNNLYEDTLQHKQYLSIVQDLVCTMNSIPLRIPNKDSEEAAAILFFTKLISQIKLLGVYSTVSITNTDVTELEKSAHTLACPLEFITRTSCGKQGMQHLF